VPQTAPAARVCLIRAAFAHDGIGAGASGTVSKRGAVTITESFAKPSTCP